MKFSRAPLSLFSTIVLLSACGGVKPKPADQPAASTATGNTARIVAPAGAPGGSAAPTGNGGQNPATGAPGNNQPPASQQPTEKEKENAAKVAELSEKYEKMMKMYEVAHAEAESLKAAQLAPTSITSPKEAKLFIELDDAISEFNRAAKPEVSWLDRENERRAWCSSLDAALSKANEKLAELETELVRLLGELLESAKKAKAPAANQTELEEIKKSFTDRNSKLIGIRTLLEKSHKTTSSDVSCNANAGSPAKGPNPPVSPVKKTDPAKNPKPPGSTPNKDAKVDVKPSPPRKFIAVDPSDQKAGEALPGTGGLAKRAKNDLVVLGGLDQILGEARSKGLREDAVKNAYEMMNKTGGVIYLADRSEEVGKAIASSLLGHIKTSMNKNHQSDLELVFVLDYSGSMRDDIDSVIKNLVLITKSLKSVKMANGKVKIGISTFGQPGLEKINLALTENLSAVQSKLDDLLGRYPTETHFTEPGEASFHGLNISADKIQWSPGNNVARKVLLITDEPSQEIVQQDTSYVDQVFAKYKKAGVEINIYPLIVN